MTFVSTSIGSRLRAERESRGIALADVADATKIAPSLLEALERDDLARWPKGMYRRSFFRAYRLMKCEISAEMSSGLSRNGGTFTFSVAIR